MATVGQMVKQLPLGTIAAIVGGFLLLYFVSTGDWPWKKSSQ